MELVAAEKIEDCVCEEIDLMSENPKSIFNLGYELGRFAFDNEGNGLAAPQVGIFRRIIVFQGNDGLMMIAVNPRYFPQGSRTQIVEGCLSYPGDRYLMKRYKSVRAMFFTFNSEKKIIAKNIILRGHAAIVFQHETDHLNGITIAMKGKFFGHVAPEEVKEADTNSLPSN